MARLIVDREGMAAEFLATLVKAGRTVVTILQSDQYQGLASFSEVGPFVPLCRDRAGNVTREVAPARFALTLPDHPGETLPLRVALIRDLRRQVPTSVPARRGHLSRPVGCGSGSGTRPLVGAGVGGNASAGSPYRAEAHSHRDHRSRPGCRRTGPDLHPPLARAREQHP